VISSLVHHVRPDDGLIEKGAETCCLSFDSLQLNKSFCCVLTYPPYISCDIVIAHNGHEPPKDDTVRS